MKLNIIDYEGFYIGDYVEGDMPERWTADLLGDGYYKAQYKDYAINIETGEASGGHWIETSGPTNEQILSDNSSIANSLKDSAMASIQILLAKMNIGRTLTAEEKAKVNLVLDYCDAVNLVDLSVPNPYWPELPNT